MHKKHLRIILWSLAAGIAVFIFIMSSRDSTQSSNTSSGFIKAVVDALPHLKNLSDEQKLNIVAEMQFIVRKMAHGAIYFLLGLVTSLAMLCYEIKLWKRPAISLGICLLYAVSDEIHQLFVPGRSGEIRDVLIDFTGALTATMLVLLVRFITVKKRKPRPEVRVNI